MIHMRPLILMLCLSLAFVQMAAANPFARLTGAPLHPDQAFRHDVIPDGLGGAEVRWIIAPGYYLYRENFTATDATGRRLEIRSPPGIAQEDMTFGTVEVYPRDVVIRLPHASGDLRLGWQGCQDGGICYAPQTALISLPLQPDMPGQDDGAALAPTTEVDALHAQGGLIWVLLGFAGMGLLLAFTPCTFPMLPVLWAMLGGECARGARATGLAGSYVLGMSMGFALIGALAGWLGSGLQFALQSPVVILAGAAVFALLAAASLDLVPIRLPAGLGARLAGIRGQGSIPAAALAGLGSVLVLGPCVTAPLAGGLIYIAQTGDVVLGAGALAMLGMGQGLPLMVLALFGRRVLPANGPWLVSSRRIFGVVLAGMAIWLASRVLPGPVGLMLWAMLALAVSAACTGTGILARFTARLCLGLGIVQMLGAAAGGSDPLRPLAGIVTLRVASAPSLTVTSTAQLRQALAANAHRLNLVYVTADWCVICRGLERDVFSDPAVIEALSDLRFIKADVTDFNADGGDLARHLQVIGPPTVVMLDEAGRELPHLRLTGAFDSAMLLDMIGKAGS